MKLFNNIYKGKKVLVTGHTGFKGSWLILWLDLLGAKVCGFSNNEKTIPSLFNILKLKKKITNYTGDISNFNDISKTIKKFQPEVIFHLAAQSLVKESYLKPIKTFKTNSLGTLNLLKASEQGKKLKVIVLITSDKVYKNIEIQRGYKEDDVIMGNDPYSASKSCAEVIANMYIHSFLNKKVKVCITRAGNVIGGGDWSKDRIIPDLFKTWSKNKCLNIRNPNSTRPWQFILEPLGAYLYLGSLLLKNNNKINLKSFNVGPRQNVDKTVNELMLAIKRIIPNLNYKEIKDKNNKEAKLLRLNCKKIYKYTKWQPIYNFNRTVDNTINWYIKYKEKKNEMNQFSIEQIKNYVKFARLNKIKWIKE
ncbi:CDP-glucose 4,6-dehydratase [Candidatus Pelagibacter sp.]|jgi:CDP-glucose 4,6-dehydratase|nr:CDP-glucose 4,6-dehydratase [Candidatus Pelagibacter sp.]